MSNEISSCGNEQTEDVQKKKLSLCIHILRPWHVGGVAIELRAWRPAAHAHVLHEIASAALGQPVGVVCWWAVGDCFRATFIEVAEIVGDLF